jgi:predicted GNAT superfamily acetyltransferase
MDSANDRSPKLQIRPLRSQADFEASVALQREIWGDDVREIVPPAILKVSQEVGGIAAGAFNLDGTLAGFVFGMTGIKNGAPVHWSHLLAVADGFRDQGIGHRLKLYQRSRLQEAGVLLAYWTFDPLEARNAHLNLNRLGAKVERYVADMYGADPVAQTDTIIGTDRFVVRWDLAAPPASPATGLGEEAPIVTGDPADAAAAEPPLAEAPLVRVEVPRDIQWLKSTDPDSARRWRHRTRRALAHYLDRGYAIRGLLTNQSEARAFYVLESPT